MEQYSNNNIPIKESVLKIPHVVFDELSFIREGFQSTEKHETRFHIGYTVSKIEDSYYRATISSEVIREQEFKATVKLSGYCIVDENDPNKEDLLKENALAILFPYVRAEMSLLTTQPETEPVVWPVVNIREMLKESVKDSEEKI